MIIHSPGHPWSILEYVFTGQGLLTAIHSQVHFSVQSSFVKYVEAPGCAGTRVLPLRGTRGYIHVNCKAYQIYRTQVNREWDSCSALQNVGLVEGLFHYTALCKYVRHYAMSTQAYCRHPHCAERVLTRRGSTGKYLGRAPATPTCTIFNTPGNT